MQTIETLSVKLVGDVTAFNVAMLGAGKVLDTVADKMDAAGNRLQTMGQRWSMFVSAPLLALGKRALDTAAAYETSMNVMAQVTEATAGEMAALSAQALKMGKDTIFSAGEAAQAQLELAKAGMNVSDVMSAMPGILDLAAAGNVELGQAAKVTAGVLNAFNLKAADSARVANLLAGAANASAADISDLTLGMAQGGFAFSAAGWKVDDLAASLAILTNVGLKGTDAGTALKNMTMQLIGPTEKAAKIMRILGINVFDGNGKMKNFGEVVSIFQDKMSILTEQERLWALENILGSDGMKAMIPLLSQGADGIAAMTAAVTKSGQSSAVANARMKGLTGAIEYFKGTIDTLLIQSTTPWLDEISRIIRATADWIAKFGDLDPALQRNIVKFLALAAAIGPVLIYAGMLVSAVAGLISVFGLLFNPVVVIGVALAKLLLPMDKVNKAFDSIKSVALRALDLLRTGVLSALTAIEKMFGVNLSAVRRGVEVAYTAIGEIIRGGFFKYITDLLRSHWESWKRKFWEIAKVVEAWAREWGRLAWRWIVDVAIPMSLEKLKGWANALIDWAKGEAPRWRNALIEWGNAAWQWITDVAIPKAREKLGEWWALLSNWATTNYPLWRDTLAQWATAAWAWITNVAIPKTVEKLGEWWAALSVWAEENYPTWKAKFDEWGSAAWAWLRDTAIPKTVEYLAELWTKLQGWYDENYPLWKEKWDKFAAAAAAWIWEKVIPQTVKDMAELWAKFQAWYDENYPTWKANWDKFAENPWVWLRDTAIPKTGEYLAELWTKFQGWYDENYPTWKANWDKWSDATWVWLQDTAIPKIKSNLADLWDYVKAWSEDNVPSLASWMQEFEDLAAAIGKHMPYIKQVTKENTDAIVKDIGRILTAMSELFTFTKNSGPDLTASWAKIFVGMYTVSLQIKTVTVELLASLLEGIVSVKKAIDAMLVGDWASVATIKDDFNKIVGGMQGTLVEDMAKWIDPLYWVGLRPESLPNMASTSDRLRGAYANGGMVGQSGLYKVGEWGEEIVELPAGAYVHSNDKIGNSITINIPLTVGAGADPSMITRSVQNGVLMALRQVGAA